MELQAQSKPVVLENPSKAAQSAMDSQCCRYCSQHPQAKLEWVPLLYYALGPWVMLHCLKEATN